MCLCAICLISPSVRRVRMWTSQSLCLITQEGYLPQSSWRPGRYPKNIASTCYITHTNHLLRSMYWWLTYHIVFCTVSFFMCRHTCTLFLLQHFQKAIFPDSFSPCPPNSTCGKTYALLLWNEWMLLNGVFTCSVQVLYSLSLSSQLHVKPDIRMNFIDSLNKSVLVFTLTAIQLLTDHTVFCYRFESDTDVLCMLIPVVCSNSSTKTHIQIKPVLLSLTWQSCLARICHTLIIVFPERAEELVSQTIIKLYVDESTSPELHNEVGRNARNRRLSSCLCISPSLLLFFSSAPSQLFSFLLYLSVVLVISNATLMFRSVLSMFRWRTWSSGGSARDFWMPPE